MSNYILNGAQLQELQAFIRKRGFKDEPELAEILDHFACKVEEIRTAHPGMNLDTAMEKAHRSFGVRGFRPIAEAFTRQLSSRYRRMFRKYLWHEIVLSLNRGPFLLPAGYILFRGFAWTEINGYRHILDINDLLLAAWSSLTLIEIILNVRLGRLKSESYKTAVKSRDIFTGPALAGIIAGISTSRLSGSGPAFAQHWIIPALFTAFVLILVIRQVAFAHIIRQAKAEIEELA